MVINTNSQLINPATLNSATVGKAVNRSAESNGSSLGQDTNDVTITLRGTESVGGTEIETEDAAADTTWLIRDHILGNPAGALGVQANSRPEVVFELLQGIL